MCCDCVVQVLIKYNMSSSVAPASYVNSYTDCRRMTCCVLNINAHYRIFSPHSLRSKANCIDSVFQKLLVGIIYFVFIGYRFLPDGKGAVEATVEKQKDFSNVPKWKQIVSLVVLILVILAMIFEDLIGVSIEISACVGAIILVLFGVLSEKEALASIDLKVVFLFGGSLTLAKALDTTGAGELIADKIVGLLSADPNPIVLLLVIFVVTCALTNFMSNTATTALMIPIAVSLANNLGADPRAVVIATVIAGSCAYATPIGMPANTMVVGLGGYKFKDYVKSGLPLILVSFVICMILLPVLFPFYP